MRARLGFLVGRSARYAWAALAAVADKMLDGAAYAVGFYVMFKILGVIP